MHRQAPIRALLLSNATMYVVLRQHASTIAVFTALTVFIVRTTAWRVKPLIG